MLDAAVLADPWPDAPRAAWADAAASREPDRARLIRDELTLLRARRAGVRRTLPEQGRMTSLKARVARVVLPAFADLPGARFGLGRGFVESVEAPLDWLEAHPELFARAPILDVRLTAVDVPRLLRAPWLGRVRWLSLPRLGLTDADAERLADADLPRLCALDLAANHIGPSGLDALGRTRLPSLRFVVLTGNPLVDPNFETSWEGEAAVGPRPTAASEAFLARHPGCRWIGRYSAEDPPLPGVLHDAEGRAR